MLVDPWPPSLRRAVEKDFVQAVSVAKLRGSSCPIPSGTTNQSVGNKVEEFTVAKLSRYLSVFRLQACRGAGYPDKMLVRKSTSLAIPLEFKVTGNWNSNDSNRRVLTSSSSKLRNKFKTPIHHLLATVVYTKRSTGVRIDRLRLDFLEPSTTVNVRLEASVSHRLLASGGHRIKII